MTKRSQSRRAEYRGKDHRVQEQDNYSFKGKIQTTTYIKPVNESQRKMIQSIKNNTISLVSGQAGTGKSLCALYEGIRLVNSEYSDIKKIFFIRANVGMPLDSGIGFLPGDKASKILPLAYPVLDNLIEFMEEGKAKFIIEKEIIEVLPISMVRGRSFANSYVIVDEASSMTSHMIKAALTRISHGSKMVFLGDTGQIDIADKAKSGYQSIINRLSDCPDVGIIKFNKNEVVRHPIIAPILERLEGLD
jgi:phosphate starvation-inducible PhoH-like protein